jgi:hypothetical protein
MGGTTLNCIFLNPSFGYEDFGFALIFKITFGLPNLVRSSYG